MLINTYFVVDYLVTPCDGKGQEKFPVALISPAAMRAPQTKPTSYVWVDLRLCFCWEREDCALL